MILFSSANKNSKILVSSPNLSLGNIGMLKKCEVDESKYVP